MRSALIASVLLGGLMGCAGRPSFQRPACEAAYDDCVSGCDDRCDTGLDQTMGPPGQATPLPEEPQADCARCVNACNEAAARCER